MYKRKLIWLLFYFLCGHVIKAQLEGGLLGILKPEGAQVSLPGLLGIGKKTTKAPITTTTSSTTTTTTTTPAPTAKPSKTTTETVVCGYTSTFVNGKRTCRGKLIFQENFSKLQDNKWLKENRFATDPDYEFTIYQENEENLYIQKNTLHIRPTLTDDKYGIGFVTGDEELNMGDNCTGRAGTEECVQTPRAWQIIPPTISSLLSTRDRFSFLYGIIEIRARLPKGNWIYPQIYLKPKSNYYGPGYESGLIKIAHVYGNANLSKILYGGVLLSESNFGRSYALKTVDSHIPWNHDFHVFKVEWKPDSITFSVDDEVFGVVEPLEGGFGSLTDLEHNPDVIAKWQRGSKLAPFDKEMFLNLGVGVGGQTFLDSEDLIKPWDNNNPKGPLQFYRERAVWTKTWGDSSDLVVDYVKIWAL